MRVLDSIIKYIFFFQIIQQIEADRYGFFPKRECSSESSSGVVCKSSVSIECTYTDDAGDKRSCLAEDDYSYFLYEEQDKCGEIFATITMTICNDNIESNHSIMPWQQGTSFMFAGEQLDSSTLYDNVLEPGHCHAITVERTINTCNKHPNYWPMSVQFQGNMPNLYVSNYCSCSLYRKSCVKKIDPIKRRPTEIKKQCELTHENGNICNAEVSISCEYQEDGLTKSCLGHGGRKNSKYPFIRIYEHQCKTIYANLTLSMCNYGNQVFYPWKSAAFKYEGTEVDTVSNPINPNECYTWTEIKAFEPCVERSWKMSAAMYGGIGDERNWCGCYLFNDSRAQLLPEPPLVALAPSSSPTISSSPSVSFKPSRLPSASPSTVPSTNPSISSNPSTNPSYAPSTAPSVSLNPSLSQSPSGSLIGYAVCGSTFCAKRNCGDPTDTIVDNCETTDAVAVGNPETELRAVRCCKTALGSQELTDNWRRKFPETCPSGTYGASLESDGITCLPEKATYEEAENACTAIDGRLCTIEELQSDCTMNTGCNYDRLMIWASELDQRSKQPSSNPSKSNSPSFVPSMSASPSQSNVPTSGHTSDSPSVSMIGYAICGTQRCGNRQCGQATDSIPDNCEVATPVIADNPFADMFAVRCCNEFVAPPDFLWYRAPNTKCPPNVYSTSYESDGATCLPLAATYSEAAELCSTIGGRLCTKTELTSDCTKNSGCMYDRRMIWAGELDSKNHPSSVSSPVAGRKLKSRKVERKE